MLITTFTKQPAEKIRRTIDYTCRLDNGQTIDTVITAIDIVSATPLIVDTYKLTGDKQLEYFVSGGLDGETFIITFSVTLSDGQVMEDEVELYIEEL